MPRTQTITFKLPGGFLEIKIEEKVCWNAGNGIFISGNTKRGKYHCTDYLLFDWFGISCMTTDNYCFYLQNRLIQEGQTEGQWYSDTAPFSIPCFYSREFKSQEEWQSLISIAKLDINNLLYKGFSHFNLKFEKTLFINWQCWSLFLPGEWSFSNFSKG